KEKKVPMPDFDTFWKGDGIVEFPVSDEAKNFVRYAKFREDPLLNPLGTPSGLIEIYSKNIEKMAYDDCPPHPTWMEPAERLGGANPSQTVRAGGEKFAGEPPAVTVFEAPAAAA